MIILCSVCSICSIGFGIAKKLVGDGANVMVSSRKEANVKSAVEKLQGVKGGKVEGVVCHVGEGKHRENLIKEVSNTLNDYVCRSVE